MISYGRRADEIVGYAFQADTFHPRCIIGMLPTGPGGRFDGWALAPGVSMPVEDDLNEIAAAFQIDRGQPDTNEFPVPIFSSDQEGPGSCGRCLEPLIDD